MQKPLEARLPWARAQLMKLLRRVMIRRARPACPRGAPLCVQTGVASFLPARGQRMAADVRRAAVPPPPRRASKADLVTLPPCHRAVTLLNFGPEHAASYNDLAEVIRRNLLLADWCDDEHHEVRGGGGGR